jgi:succinate dehydrogenase / fumarate reductase flavoprotein subunit
VISKVFPTRSHTVSAQGGITCAIASNDPNDDWRWHMYDTVKGSDYIGDQDAIEYMCSVGPQAVFELEHMGLPFSRTEEGRIYQRPFGGQSKDFGRGGQAARTCAAADRTGHALLHTLLSGQPEEQDRLPQRVVRRGSGEEPGRHGGRRDRDLHGDRRDRLREGQGHGAGHRRRRTHLPVDHQRHINTGDGVGMALRAGFPVQDIEMWQFHPTGIAGAGCW